MRYLIRVRLSGVDGFLKASPELDSFEVTPEAAEAETFWVKSSANAEIERLKLGSFATVELIP
jgi:hypothetical protein